jgi:hypothetical protein
VAYFEGGIILRVGIGSPLRNSLYHKWPLLGKEEAYQCVFGGSRGVGLLRFVRLIVAYE